MSNTKSVDSSLWWHPFSSLLTDLENAFPSSHLSPHSEKKLKENRAWFVDMVSLFKPPNEKSKEALNSEKLKIGTHELNIKPELRDKAFRISSYLSLDEVQSYILVERSFEHNSLSMNSITEDYIHVVLLYYYVERQCLLKCVRQIIVHALYIGISSREENLIKEEALKLISNGLEGKLISLLLDLMSAYHVEQMDVDLFTLWAEETLTEDNLVLEILFLLYYESLCPCSAETWKKLCSLYMGILSGSYNSGKLEISSESLRSSSQAKIQLLFILIKTLNMENLLCMVHDETPFSKSSPVMSDAFCNFEEITFLDARG